MKKRSIALLLCAAILMSLFPVMSTLAYDSSPITVTASSTTLPENADKDNGSVTLTAAPASGSVSASNYHWQILIPSAKIWVDITGASGAKLDVTYAMVASALSGKSASLRAAATVSGETAYSEAVSLTIGEALEPAAVKAADVTPKVLSQAKATTTPTTAPTTAPTEAPAVDTAALEKAVTDAEASLKAAQEALTAAQAKVEPAKAAQTAAAQAVTDAETALSAAKAALETPAEGANTEDLQAAVTAAESKLAEVTDQRAIADATAVKAESDAKLAADAVTAAETALKDAKAALEAAQTPAAAPVRRAPAISLFANESNTNTTYSVVINYVFGDGKIAADPYTATLAAGSNFPDTVKHPTVQGYVATQGEGAGWESGLTFASDEVTVNIANISADITVNVVYQPTNVNYTVIHYQQGVDNDNYTQVAQETKTGKTNSTVPEVANKYDGFYALLYEKPAIAADGSTVVEVYYDRYYYLMNFDLDGGYGVEPIYARYGAPISVGEPTKAGYTFQGWGATIPSTMPAESKTYKANWTAGEVSFTVAFWYENADDNGYTVVGSAGINNVAPGTSVSSGTYKDTAFTGRDDKHFTYNADKAETATVAGDGSTVLNVYFTRNTYTLTFNTTIYDCGKVEHEHTYTSRKWVSSGYMPWEGYYLYYGGCYPESGAQNPTCGIESHEHSSYWCSSHVGTVKTISAKYGAFIKDQFPIVGTDGTSYNGYWWQVPNGTETYAAGKYLLSIDVMPGEKITFTGTDYGTDAKLYYYVEKLSGDTTINANGTFGPDRQYQSKYFEQYKPTVYSVTDGYFTYLEEFYTIPGFTQWKSDPAFDTYGSGGTAEPQAENYFYYTRNSYQLKFYNYNADLSGATKTVQFEAPLASYYFEPGYPNDMEPNAYRFEGWYTTPECLEGTKFDFTNGTMPANDLTLYANWVPVTHTVEFYLDKDAYDKNEKLESHPDLTVPHGSKVETVPAKPSNGSYSFVGWFYMDGNTEKAIDFANMPINKDLKVYGKWSSNVLKNYFVYYKIQDTNTDVAAPTTGSGLAGSTKTFEAKGGTDLYTDYQEGYFPVVKSHSLTIDIENEANNTFTFWYVRKEAVPYTVKYLNKETGEPVATEKTVSDNRKAVVTETFVPVARMMPDAYQKRLVVSGEEGAVNEIIFYYTEDTTHAYYKITHFTQNTDGESWTVYASSQAVGDIGKTYSAGPMTIPGFTFDRTVDGTVESGVLTANGLELKLYYTRNSYPYEVRYLEQGTGKVLHDPKTTTEDGKPLTGLYGKVISESPIDIANYTPVYPTSQTLTIMIEEGETAKLNVITFYYKENEATINYVVVGPDGCGTVTPTSETLKVLSGTAQGSTAAANDNFRFLGWYSDAECTTKVSDDLHYTPTKGENDVWTNVNYYAKFEHDVTTLTITKSGANETLDPGQSFIFIVEGENLPTNGLKVTVTGNGSVTIGGLKVGSKYTITEERGWSWRYRADSVTTAPLVANGNKVTVANERPNVLWLDGNSVCHNVFE